MRGIKAVVSVDVDLMPEWGGMVHNALLEADGACERCGYVTDFLHVKQVVFDDVDLKATVVLCGRCCDEVMHGWMLNPWRGVSA